MTLTPYADVPYARFAMVVEERSQFIDRIEALEAALREIATLSMVDICSWDDGFYKARDIARKALGEE